MQRKKIFTFLILAFICTVSGAQTRKIIHIPDIPGFQTLKCDFHMHSVFSDGTVWPTVRVQEAWEEGLDAISITDHIEYRPHSKDVVADHNRSFDIAEPLAKELNIILVKGAEITRSMPPGHLNAIFIKNANLLERDNVNEAIREAHNQGAFIFWNHPGWKKQQPDTTLWWNEHTVLYRNNLLNGIEVYNSNEFYPEALEWAKEKKLTMFGNSDTHGPVKAENGHRPMTLVFAKSRTLGGIKEALFDKRTAVYFGNTLVGSAQHLNQLFFASLDFENAPIRLENESSKVIYIQNNSDLDFELERAQPGVGFDAPESVTLPAHKVSAIELTGNSDEVKTMRSLTLYYRVKNLVVGSHENLVVTMSVRNL